jgi:hypothetical protein
MRVLHCVVPVTSCNLSCGYCINVKNREWDDSVLPFDTKTVAAAISPERFGDELLVNIVGVGETLLPSYIIDLTRDILRRDGAYVQVVTNGTINKRVAELCDFPDKLKSKLCVRFSFHWNELVRAGKLDDFFANFRRLRENCISASAVLMTDDSLIPEIPRILEVSVKNLGAPPHVIPTRYDLGATIARHTAIPESEAVWAAFNSPVFDIYKNQFTEKVSGFCYGGDWCNNIYLEDGRVGACCYYVSDTLNNIFDDQETRFAPTPIGSLCPYDLCSARFHGNVVNGSNYRTWAAFDREIPDGTSWFQGEFKQFTRQMPNDTHWRLDSESESWIDAIHRFEWRDDLAIPNERTLDSLSSALSGKSVAVYGDGGLTEWLVTVLTKAGVYVKYQLVAAPDAIKRNAAGALKRLAKYRVKRIIRRDEYPVLLNTRDALPKVDLMIAADYRHIHRIKAALANQSMIVPITEILDFAKGKPDVMAAGRSASYQATQRGEL